MGVGCLKVQVLRVCDSTCSSNGKKFYCEFGIKGQPSSQSEELMMTDNVCNFYSHIIIKRPKDCKLKFKMKHGKKTLFESIHNFSVEQAEPKQDLHFQHENFNMYVELNYTETDNSDSKSIISFKSIKSTMKKLGSRQSLSKSQKKDGSERDSTLKSFKSETSNKTEITKEIVGNKNEEIFVNAEESIRSEEIVNEIDKSIKDEKPMIITSATDKVNQSPKYDKEIIEKSNDQIRISEPELVINSKNDSETVRDKFDNKEKEKLTKSELPNALVKIPHKKEVENSNDLKSKKDKKEATQKSNDQFKDSESKLDSKNTGKYDEITNVKIAEEEKQNLIKDGLQNVPIMIVHKEEVIDNSNHIKITKDEKEFAQKLDDQMDDHNLKFDSDINNKHEIPKDSKEKNENEKSTQDNLPKIRTGRMFKKRVENLSSLKSKKDADKISEKPIISVGMPVQNLDLTSNVSNTENPEIDLNEVPPASNNEEVEIIANSDQMSKTIVNQPNLPALNDKKALDKTNSDNKANTFIDKNPGGKNEPDEKIDKNPFDTYFDENIERNLAVKNELDEKIGENPFDMHYEENVMEISELLDETKHTNQVPTNEIDKKESAQSKPQIEDKSGAKTNSIMHEKVIIEKNEEINSSKHDVNAKNAGKKFEEISDKFQCIVNENALRKEMSDDQSSNEPGLASESKMLKSVSQISLANDKDAGSEETKTLLPAKFDLEDRGDFDIELYENGEMNNDFKSEYEYVVKETEGIQNTKKLRKPHRTKSATIILRPNRKTLADKNRSSDIAMANAMFSNPSRDLESIEEEQKKDESNRSWNSYGQTMPDFVSLKANSKANKSKLAFKTSTSDSESQKEDDLQRKCCEAKEMHLFKCNEELNRLESEKSRLLNDIQGLVVKLNALAC